MRRLFNILRLRYSIYKLKRARKDALLDISKNYPNEANRVNRLEDVRSDFFRDIDYKIASRSRLLHLKSKYPYFGKKLPAVFF